MSSTPQTPPNTLHPNARQCAYIKTNGMQCGAPAKGEADLCHSHLEHKQRAYPQTILLPPLDDAHSIQVATLDIMNALLYQRIDKSTATGLLYGLQLAQTNLKNFAAAAQPAAAGRPKNKNGKPDGQEDTDYDENGDPLSLSAILLKELRESAGLVSVSTGPKPAGEAKPEWWTEKKSS